MNISDDRIEKLWKKGCSIKRIAKWGDNADNPNMTAKPLEDRKEFESNFRHVEKVIYNYQKRVGMI